MTLLKRNLLYLFAFLGLMFLVIQNLSKANTVVDSATKEITEVRVLGKDAQSKEGQLGLALIQQNLAATNDQNITAYLDTIVKSAKTETKAEIAPFFKEYKLENTLISYEVKKMTPNAMLIETQQRTLNKGKNNYRSHIATITHKLVQEDNQWKIKESNVTNSEFIKE